MVSRLARGNDRYSFALIVWLLVSFPALVRGQAPTAPAAPEAPSIDEDPGPVNRRVTDVPERRAPRSDLLASWLRSSQSSRNTRLANAPKLLGDTLNLGTDIAIASRGVPTDVVLGAASRRMKVTENNAATPTDRVFFLYNHFHNALELDRAPTTSRDLSVNRYTIGFEKTFHDGLWSVDMRMPLAGEINATTTNYITDGGSVGNLAILLKRLVYEDDLTAVAVGLGIDTPTGSDAQGALGANRYTIHNQAVHLAPFIGFDRVPSDIGFYHGFLQLDIPTNGNDIDFVDSFGAVRTPGTVNEQTLLYADFGVGYWLSRNECAEFMTGLAALVELHYTTTLQDADIVFDTATPSLRAGNFDNRVDVLNLTVGLHAELTGSSYLRVGGVVPLRDDGDRLFDSELQVQFERQF